MKVVQRGIAYLPPGRTLKYLVGRPDWKSVEGSDAVIAIQVSSRTGGHLEHREFYIDMAQFLETRSERSPIDELVEVVERVGRRDHTRAIFERAKKFYVECAEAMPAAARKCSHCGTVQPQEEKQAEDGTSDA